MKKISQEYDFIFITQSRWDDVSSTAYSLAQEFSKKNRVFYIDKPFTWLDLIRFNRNKKIRSRLSHYLLRKNTYQQLKGLPDKFTLVITFLTIPINWLPPGKIYRFFLSLQQKRMERRIRLLKQRFNIRQFILFNSFNPFYSIQLPDDIAPSIKIYQCVDSMKAAKYLSKHGTYLEDEIAKQADFVLATSKQIVSNLNAKGFTVQYLPNAANIEHFKSIYFKSTTKPNEFPGDKEVIGYIGSIDFRTNFKLLYALAKKYEEKILMLIGPVRMGTDLQGIDTLSNVIFTGSKPMDQLPFYAKSLDCAIIPFEHNEFTRSVYPLKINEYLAAGRPVVTTCFSNEMEDFKEIAYVTDDEEQFIQYVNLALTHNTKEKEIERIQFSENNSWEKRVEEFWKIVNNYTQQK